MAEKFVYEHVCYLFVEKQEMILRIIYVSQRRQECDETQTIIEYELLMTELETWNVRIIF